MVSKFLTRAAARAKLASAVAVATAKMHEIFMPLVVLADARWLQCKSHMHVCHKEVPSGLQTASRDRFNSRRKEGRKITHHSSRLGLIGWTGSIQIIKTSITICATPTMSNCHMNCCMVTMSAPNNPGYLSRIDCKAGHSKTRESNTGGGAHHMHGAIWHLEPSAPAMMSACLLLQIAPKALSELPGKACTWIDGLIITSA
jgi:hypothetical protein